jgi:hypothetical protein
MTVTFLRSLFRKTFYRVSFTPFPSTPSTTPENTYQVDIAYVFPAYSYVLPLLSFLSFFLSFFSLLCDLGFLYKRQTG